MHQILQDLQWVDPIETEALNSPLTTPAITGQEPGNQPEGGAGPKSIVICNRSAVELPVEAPVTAEALKAFNDIFTLHPCRGAAVGPFGVPLYLELDFRNDKAKDEFFNLNANTTSSDVFPNQLRGVFVSLYLAFLHEDMAMALANRAEAKVAILISFYGKPNMTACGCCINSYADTLTPLREYHLAPFAACVSSPDWAEGACSNCIWKYGRKNRCDRRGDELFREDEEEYPMDHHVATTSNHYRTLPTKANSPRLMVSLAVSSQLEDKVAAMKSIKRQLEKSPR